VSFKYNPENYADYDGGYLRKLLLEIYAAYETKDDVGYEIYRSHITNELKFLWKSGIISRSESEEMKDYFWGELSL